MLRDGFKRRRELSTESDSDYELGANEKSKRKKIGNLMNKCILFVLLICLFLVYDFEIFIHFEAQIEVIVDGTSECDKAFDVSSMLVVISGMERSSERREHAQKKCDYFEANGIDCRIFDAFDGELLRAKHNASDLMNDLIKRRELPANSEKLGQMNEKGVGGMACSITKTMLYRSLAQKEFGSEYEFVLIAEDDAIFPLDFVEQLTRSMSQLSKHRVSRKWDFVNLYPLSWCNSRNIHRSHLQRMSGTLYRYHQRQPFALGLLSGYASEVAIVFKMKSIKEKIIRHLPVDMFNDLWLAELIRNRELNAFTFCPPVIGHGRFASDIEKLNNHSD